MSTVDLYQAIDRFIAETANKAGIPGLALAVIKNNEVHIQTYKHAKAPKREIIDRDTLFEIGSLSKAFTCLGLLLLKNQGKVDLDEQVSFYVPWFTMYYCNPESGKREAGRMTLRHLMYHRSGIPFRSLSLLPSEDSSEALKHAVQKLNGKRLCFKPGDGYLYASYNTDILAYVIEVVTGLTFEDYMKQYVLTPLGLHHTYLTYESARRTRKLSSGYRHAFFKARRYRAPVCRANVPGGKMISSISDMARWVQIQMGQIQVDENFRRAIFESHTGQFILPDDASSYLAAGWDAKRETNVIKYRGLNSNYSSMILFDKDLQNGICILSNLSCNTTYYMGENALKAQKPTTISPYKMDRMKKLDRLFSIPAILFFVTFCGLLLILADGIFPEFRYSSFHLARLLPTCGWLMVCGILLYKLPMKLTDYKSINWRLVFEWSPPSFYCACIFFFFSNVLAGLLWCLR